jgi:hypothetical protein
VIKRRDFDADSDDDDDRRLRAFAAAAKASANLAPERYRFGRSKVFIAALEPSRATKRLLVDAHRAGYVRLSRADLTQAMPRDLIEESETTYMNATWHLIEVEPREEWSGDRRRTVRPKRRRA